LACALLAALGVGCGAAAQSPAASAPAHHEASNQILAPRAEGTAKELRAKGERALLAQRWQEAVDALEAVLAGEPTSASDPQLLYDLAVAYEGLGERAKARARYREVVRRFPGDPNARNALVREVSLDAHLEDWAALGDVSVLILARPDLDPAEKMLGLGARGLSRIQAGDETAATRAIQQGLELMDETRYGATGQLPVAAAMLKYGNGELRKFRSEKISLNPPGPDFVLKLEMRCAFLLEAQSSYADAIRAVDPQWAAMSGFRVGEMYRTLHHDLMLIPPTAQAKTESDKQLFYGIMHVRYRVLLEKGMEMMKRTLALGERTGVGSAWMKRAEDLRLEMDKALDEEKAAIARFPFTEGELQKALEIMKLNATKGASADAKRQAPSTGAPR
jgi:tetratricopeptide (TPR) repeat protein